MKHEYAGAYLKRVCEIPDASANCAGQVNQFVIDAIYDGTGKVTRVSLPPGIRSFDYDLATERRTRDAFAPTNAAGYAVEFRYKASGTNGVPYYDPVGNLLQVDATSSDPAIKFGGTYTYDNHNRLSTWTRTGQSTLSYSYDPLGNLINKEGVQQNYSLTKPHQLLNLAGTKTYTYDASGNIQSLQRAAGVNKYFHYDSANRLTFAGSSASGCNELLVKYAGDGERVYQNGTYYAGIDFAHLSLDRSLIS
ncbi:MAG: hypothetical protein IPK00_21080 [Deltaproteobacteria bacterium]|nr:hypothetical protein [Deltaproteobacteria bacterium]